MLKSPFLTNIKGNEIHLCRVRYCPDEDKYCLCMFQNDKLEKSFDNRFFVTCMPDRLDGDK